MIGVYNRETLRVRWSSRDNLAIEIELEKVKREDAAKSGGLPLPDNWRKTISDTNFWPQMPAWNEAVDGPKHDSSQDRAWITLKATTIEKCR